MTKEFVDYSGPIVTRAEAIKSCLTRYFTGKRCKSGHLDQRITKKKQCCSCNFVWKKKDVVGIERRRKREVLERNARKHAIAGSERPDICDICGETDKAIRFDHCHYTGKFRGWICTRCNCMLGYAKDSTELLRKMADYLDSHGEVKREEKKFPSSSLVRWPRSQLPDS
jgi:hypothetical protein